MCAHIQIGELRTTTTSITNRYRLTHAHRHEHTHTSLCAHAHAPNPGMLGAASEATAAIAGRGNAAHVGRALLCLLLLLLVYDVPQGLAEPISKFSDTEIDVGVGELITHSQTCALLVIAFVARDLVSDVRDYICVFCFMRVRVTVVDVYCFQIVEHVCTRVLLVFAT